MRKKILEALNTKFPGVSDNKLNRIVDNLLKKIKSEDEIQAAVDAITVESLLDSYGDARANLSRDSIIRDYETKHNLKDGKPVESKPSGEPTAAATNTGGGTGQVTGGASAGEQGQGGVQLSAEMQVVMQELKAMRAENKTLSETIATMQRDKVTDTRMSTLNNLLKDVPEESRNRYLRDYGYMSFDTDDKFNAYIEAITPEIEKIKTETAQTAAHVGGTKGGGSTTPTGKVSPQVQARIDDKKAVTATPAIHGLPT